MKKSKKSKKRKKAKRRLPRLGSLVLGGVVAVIAGFIGLVIVYGAMGGGGRGEFAPDISETSSDDPGDPFVGGPRLHFPVNAIDMGQVPLNRNVSYSFAVTNVGDAAARIEEVDVTVLEGC